MIVGTASKDKHCNVIDSAPNILKFEWYHIGILFKYFKDQNRNIC